MASEESLLSSLTANTDPQYVIEEDDVLLAVADVGTKVVDFKNSEVGRLMFGYAAQEKQAAAELLLIVDPYDTKTVQTVQNRAAVAMLFERFVEEAINSGEQAYQQLLQLSGE